MNVLPWRWKGRARRRESWVEKGLKEGREGSGAQGWDEGSLFCGTGQEQEWEQTQMSLGDRKLGHVPCEPKRVLADEWSALRGKGLCPGGKEREPIRVYRNVTAEDASQADPDPRRSRPWSQLTLREWPRQPDSRVSS